MYGSISLMGLVGRLVNTAGVPRWRHLPRKPGTNFTRGLYQNTAMVVHSSVVRILVQCPRLHFHYNQDANKGLPTSKNGRSLISPGEFAKLGLMRCVAMSKPLMNHPSGTT